VQTSLLESMIAMMDLQAARWTVDGVVPEQEGNHHPTMVPMGCFRSADGFVNVAGAFGRLLHRFCSVIGLAELPADPRFDTPPKRSANRAELNRLVGEQLRQRTTAEWVELLNAAGVPCGPVLRMDEVFADPQVAHLGMVATVESSALGELGILRNAVTLAGGPPTVRSATPEAGEHTDAVLAELGVTPGEIEDLRRQHVVF
jgi:formyl-CoA transferase